MLSASDWWPCCSWTTQAPPSPVIKATFALHAKACERCSSCCAEDIVEHEQDAVEDTTSTGAVTEGGHPVKEAVQEVSTIQAKGTRRHWALVMSGSWASFNHALWKLLAHRDGGTQSFITSLQGSPLSLSSLQVRAVFNANSAPQGQS